MGRNWQPKYGYYCEACGWSGIRTQATGRAKPCPTCGAGRASLQQDFRSAEQKRNDALRHATRVDMARARKGK